MLRAASDCQGLHQRCAGGRYCGHFAPTLEKLVCSDGAAVRMGRSHLADAVLAAAGHNFRRLFAWLTFLLLGILIALGLAAQLPEIGFFTADLI
jgi:hypothetical protein